MPRRHLHIRSDISKIFCKKHIIGCIHYGDDEDVGDSATYLYINEVLISSAKVAVIVRGSLTLFGFGSFFVFLVIRVYDLK